MYANFGSAPKKAERAIKFLFIGLLWLSGIFPPPIFAAKSAIEAYNQAASHYILLFQDKKFQSKEANWLKTIAEFQGVSEIYPKSPEAPKALYTLGNLYNLLYSWNGKKMYIDSAKKAFESFVKSYPEDHLADDALFALAKYYHTYTKDDDRALRLYKQIVDGYKDSDFAEPAKASYNELKAEIARYSIKNTNLSKTKLSADQNPGPVLNSPADKPGSFAKGTSVAGRILPKYVNDQKSQLESIFYFSTPDWSRIVLDFNQGVEVEYKTLPEKAADGNVLVFTLKDMELAANFQKGDWRDALLVDSVEYVPLKGGEVQFKLHLKTYQSLQVYDFENRLAYKLVVDILKDPRQPPYALKGPKEKSLAEAGVEKVTIDKDAPAVDGGREKTPMEPAVVLIGKPQPPRVKASKTIVDKSPTQQTAREVSAYKAVTKPELPVATDIPYMGEDRKMGQSLKKRVNKVGANRKTVKPDLVKNEPTDYKKIRAALKPIGLAKTLGLKVRRLVIDAGHGGRDPGTIGFGLKEKEITLDLAKRVGSILKEDNPGLEIYYTRTSDTYLSLEERTQLANNKKADLFLSIHANSAPDSKVHGIETYYLNLTSEPAALSVAARENASSMKSSGELQNVLKDLLVDNKRHESAEFANLIQSNITETTKSYFKRDNDLGVKRAPFFVLIGSAMPAILIEVGFLSNLQENKLLRSAHYKDELASGIASGIESYIDQTNGPATEMTTSTALAAP